MEILNTISSIILAIIVIIGGVFCWKMFFDCIRNEKEQKFMWIYVILFFNILGALAYYYYRKKKRSELGNF